MSAPVLPSAAADEDQVLGAPVRERLRRWRPFAVALTVLLAVALLTSWTRPATSSTPLAATNPGDDGAQALAALLHDEGVSVTTVTSVDDAVAASSQQHATVALVNAGSLSTADRKRLAAAGGDVTIIGSTYQSLTGLTNLTPTGASAGTGTALSAQCEDHDAVAAATLRGSKGAVTVDGVPGAVGCFPVKDDAYAYATAPLSSGAVLRVGGALGERQRGRRGEARALLDGQAGVQHALLIQRLADDLEAERQALRATLAALPRSVSVLLVEHDMDLVFDFARRITVLVNGTLIGRGEVVTVTGTGWSDGAVDVVSFTIARRIVIGNGRTTSTARPDGWSL